MSREALLRSYALTFVLLLAVMTGVVGQFWRSRRRTAPCWAQWGPTLLAAVAAVLLLVSPLKNLVVNVCMESFRRHGFRPVIGHVLDVAYLPVFSTEMMQVYTVVAYAVMLWATSMQLDLVGRARAAGLLVLAGGRARSGEAAAAAAGAAHGYDGGGGGCPEGG